MYHSDVRATDDGAPSISPGNRTVKYSHRSFAVLISALTIAACSKDATGPLTATQLAFTIQPSSSSIDSAIVPAIAVTVEDAAGNVVTTNNALITIAISANPGNASLTGTATIVAIAGVATFPYMSLNRSGNGYTLTATAANLTSATSTAFNITSVTAGIFSSVNPGGSSTCGIGVAGKAYCWGSGNLGQLGNGGTGRFTTPSAVSGGLAFSSVASGGLDSFACGLTTAGAAYCWGYDDFGQLGNGATGNGTTVPVPVNGNLTFASLTVGANGHACGLVTSGAAFCWGYNSTGQLGVGSIGFASAPVAVSGGLTFTQLSAGESGETCGIATSGAAYCWGFNGDGELGNGTLANANTPVAVSGGLTFKNISVGFASTCALTAAGAAYCWGDNTYGELGNGSTTASKVPVAVGGGLTFKSLSVGDAYACGVTTAGTGYCWGYNGLGQLGVGTQVAHSSPTAVSTGVVFASVSAGYATTCALTPTGAAYCWGDNGFGQVGNGATGINIFPELVSTPPQ
jgi:alpha-tubulin suppressor-like RCC1 family protein